ncbi:alpha/beta fold hydrolase [Endothiovibrio diazotrophicus]
MWIEIDGLNIHYRRGGSGSPVVILHGWGASTAAVAPIHDLLEPHFDTLSVDLPGFGKSEEPPEVWGSPEYAALLERLFEQLAIHRPVLIGHSFGGKLSILLGAKGLASTLVLIDAAGIRARHGPKWYLKVYGFKLARRLATLPGLKGVFEPVVQRARERAGSSDYRNASGIMRRILVKVVNEDVRDRLPEIAVPTLLFWGENDAATPPADGRLMERLIPDAGLVVLARAGHYAYADQWYRFAAILASFLKFPI